MNADYEKISLLDPRVDLKSLNTMMIPIANSSPDITWRTFEATSTTTQNLKFICDPPSITTVIDKTVYLTTKFRHTFRGNSGAAGTTLLQCKGVATQGVGVLPGIKGYDAPRCLPLSQVISNAVVSINGLAITNALNTYSRIFQKFYRTDKQIDTDFSTSVAYPDQTQEYEEAYGYFRDPLATSLDGDGERRGGYASVLITRNDSTGTNADVAIIEYEIREPVYVNPFQSLSNDVQAGFSQVRNLNFNFNLASRAGGDLSTALWSHSTRSLATFDSVTTQVVSASMSLRFMGESKMNPIPSAVGWDYLVPNLYPTDFNSVITPGAETVLRLNNIVLSVVPEIAYFWASQRNDELKISSTDTYMGITHLAITHSNYSQLLSDCTQRDLYELSRENGYNDSFDSFSKRTGSIVAVKFGKDLQLNQSENNAPGVVGNFSMSVNIRVKNLKAYDVTPTLYMLTVTKGVFSIINLKPNLQIGLLTAQDVLESQMPGVLRGIYPTNPKGDFYGGSMAGGDFFTEVGKWFKKLLRPGLKIAKILAPEFSGIIDVVDTVAKDEGLGMKKKDKKSGGKILTNSELCDL